MKILSVRQPYAWLIARGMKAIENRTWTTRYRGPVLIHASQKLARTSIEEIEFKFGVWIPRDALRCGGVIGSAELVDVVTTHSSRWFEGPFGFVFQSAQMVPFVACNGSLGLRDVPLDFMDSIGTE